MTAPESSNAPFAACLAVLVALVVGMLLTGGGGDDDATAAASRPAAPLAVVAKRVEAIRRLRFERRPAPVTVTAAQAREEGLADLDRSYPPARRRADEAVLALLGLVPPGTDLREVAASIYEGQVAGYYDPRSGKLRIVEEAAGASVFMTEIVLAHELVHALEDQRFELREDLSGSDDADLAYSALVEGSATAVMYEYADRHFTAEQAFGGLLGSAFAPAGNLPPFIQAQLLFPYEAGQRLVETLYRRAGDRWDLVDLGLEARPPATTEQVLHPDAYIAAEPPLPVRLGRGPAAPWRRVQDGTLGEWATGRLLATVGEGSDARGWGGDRYELWRGPDGVEALVAGWRWDTARGSRAFERRLRAWASAREAPGEARVTRSGDVVRIVAGPPAAIDALSPPS